MGRRPRWLGWLVPLLAALSLLGGCAWGLQAAQATGDEITQADARRIHSGRSYQFRTLTLSPEKRASLAARYGEEYLPPEQGVRFVHIPNWRYKRHADVFQVGSDPYRLIVCVHRERVAEVYQKPSDVESGRPAIPKEFLRQFVDLGLADNFEVAATPEEAFTVPSRLRPIQGNVDLSRTIAKDVRKALIWEEASPHPQS